MAWASTPKVVLGCISFGVFWIMAVIPVVPFLPIGRTGGSLLGASLMVVFQVLSPGEAFAAVDLPILGLLFGTMVVSVYLERADMFKYLGWALSWKSIGGKDLLCRVCILSALCSAMFTNDTTCVVLTEFILKLCREKRLPPQPFLIALASSANIGSSTTPIGNPQNLVIAVESNISFGKFLGGVVPATIVGLIANTLLLLVYYSKRLVPAEDAETDAAKQIVIELVQEACRADTTSLADAPPADSDGRLRESVDAPGECSQVKSSDEKLDPANALQRPSLIAVNELLRLEPRGSQHLQAPVQSSEAAPAHSFIRRLRTKLWKLSVYLVTVGMLVAFLYGLNLSWTAITAAIVLMVLDFTDAGPSLDQVSYSLLVFFSGMFIAVSGFNKTGLPGELWDAVEPHARINTAAGIAILAVVVVLLSNVASNVPTGDKFLDLIVLAGLPPGILTPKTGDIWQTVLLLGTRVATSAAATHGASVTKAWLMLAWISTVAGNLTLVGSAANIIVSEQARRVDHLPYNLSFWNHLRFGLPATFMVIAVGLPLIQG